MEYIKAPLLTDVNVNFAGFDAFDVEPKNQSDMFAEKPIIIIGKYKSNGNGTIQLNGKTIKGDYSATVSTQDGVKSKNNEALKYLWARTRIRNLSDYNKIYNDSDLKAEITKLGLDYSLLTEFTSFVAVDNIVEDKITEKKDKVINANGSVPEPHEWVLIILSSMLVVYFVFFKQNI